MSEYPVQLSKVQPPPLREDTLARERLLDWLGVKIHRRAVLLVAEAGYGKTTLLADFSRRTRIRILWFRLDRGDRDWVGFIAHLVAAVRVHLPDFGEATSALLRETASAAPPLDTVLDTFLRELAALPNEPTALILDDFHLVDDTPEVRHMARELLTRTPDRFAFVFATRREPPIRIARLRALGEVAELGTDDLRFDAAETERLFRETYEMRLEPAVLAELSRRTEGWAASLQLVRAALHDRNPAQVRAFVSSLSGAEGHLYDYLAEEVVADLDPDLQDFLMRTSLLESVDLTLGPVAAGRSAPETKRLMDDAERHGLLSRGTAASRHTLRAHPLVREFLTARLQRSVPQADVERIHCAVADAAEATSWQTAARHYLAAARPNAAGRVIGEAIEVILATGSYAVAQELMGALHDPDLVGVAALVVRSRVAQQRANAFEGLEYAEAAWASDPEAPAVLVNLVTARTLAGDVAGALEAGSLLERSARAEAATIGRAFHRTLQTSVDGSIETAVHELEALIAALRKRSEHHFLGVALLNLAYLRLADADFVSAEHEADEAILHLSSTSGRVELISARLAKGTALAFRGDMAAARSEFRFAELEMQSGQRIEIAFEVGQVEALIGDASRAKRALDLIDARDLAPTDNGEQALLARALTNLRLGDFKSAKADAAQFAHKEPRSSVAFEARRFLTEGLVAILSKEGGTDLVKAGTDCARVQSATLWSTFGELLLALADPTGNPSDVITSQANVPAVLSMAAEMVVPRLSSLNVEAFDLVAAEAARRSERWLDTTRAALQSGQTDERIAAGHLLERIGTQDDVRRLRQASRAIRDGRASRLGVELAHRIAPRVMVEDLGRVYLAIGDRVIDGAGMRRRVLALLCLLLARPRFSATREEVLESLWPELDPAGALNSLNQTVYFLRRVFEPDYREDESPGYVSQDGETIWLNTDLIDCRSRRCVALVRASPGDPEDAVRLVDEYKGRFALDFAYDEWASAFRDHLHAAYLRVVEQAIRADIASGHFARGTYLAERASEVDRDAEGIQLALIRLYRLSDAHAAAAERYARYAAGLRGMGLEPADYAEL